MILSKEDLLVLSQTAIRAAKQAGKLIAEYADRELTVNTKVGGDSYGSQVVTEVDLMSQEIILKNLLPTCERYDLALLAEESADNLSRLEKDYFWCIDPIDGTLPFIESTPGYSVSIALVSKLGVPQIGVIFDPRENILYHSVKDVGVFRNEQPWNLDSHSDLAGKTFTFYSDRSFLDGELFEKCVVKLKAIAGELGCSNFKVITHGAAALNACWVLDHAPACYFKFPKKEEGGGSLWDFAASACIFNEIGAVAGDIHGMPLDLNRMDSTFMNHRGVLYASDHQIAEKSQLLIGELRF